MFDYIISDLHLGHSNIIEYCNRPYDNATEMDTAIISNWNSVIDESDTVLFLGDLTLGPTDVALSYLEQLNGQVIMLQGNHDRLKMEDTSSVQVLDSLIFTYKGIKFHAVHEPYNYTRTIPNQWLLHGHTHNNEIDSYPFFDPHDQSINVSVELIGYKPLSFDSIIQLIKEEDDIIETWPSINQN